MEIRELNKRPHIEQNSKLNKKYIQFEQLINELNKHDLNQKTASTINNSIEEINSISDSTKKELGKQIRKSQN